MQNKFQSFIAVGQIISKRLWQATPIVKVRIEDMKLDKNLLMYFPKSSSKWCLDSPDECKVGDIVVIKNLDEKFGKDVTGKVESVLYKVGAVRDPVTGRLCRGTEFLDENERTLELGKRTAETLKLTRFVEVASEKK